MDNFKEISVSFVLPDKADIETVIRSLGTYYYIDRVCKAKAEGEEDLFFIKEIKIESEKTPDDIVDPIQGGDNNNSIIP